MQAFASGIAVGGVAATPRRCGVAEATIKGQKVDQNLAELAGKGATLVSLEVLSANANALAVWRRLGYEPVEQTLAAPIDELAPIAAT